MTDEEHILINIQFVGFLIGAMSGLFLQIFIFKLGGITSVIQYNLYASSALLVTYVLSGYTLKKFSTKLSISAGLLLEALSLSLILVYRESSINHLFLIGVSYGLALGLYWSGYNLSQYILTHQDNRKDFFSRSNALISAGSIIGPLIGGGIIAIINVTLHSDFVGYYILFLIIFCIYIYNIVLAWSLPDHVGIDFSIRDFITHKRTKKWRYLLTQMVFLGLYDVAFVTLSGIILYVIVGQEFALGLVRTIVSLISTLASFYAGAFLKKSPRSYMWGAYIAVVGILLFGLFENYIGIIGLCLSAGIGLSYLNVAISSETLTAFDEIKESWKQKYHLFIERDMALGVARMLSYILILVFFVPSNDLNIARTWIMLIAPLPLVVAFLLQKIEK